MNRQNTTDQSGLTLIEVLVALAIFSAGLIGMISLQLAVEQQVKEQAKRNTAIWASKALVDRIKANKNLLAIQAYEQALNDQDICDQEPATICSDFYNDAGALVAAKQCNTAQMATFDSWFVLCAGNSTLERKLTGLETSMTCNGTCDEFSDITLTLQWTSSTANRDTRLGNTIQGPDGNNIAASTDWHRVQFRP